MTNTLPSPHKFILLQHKSNRRLSHLVVCCDGRAPFLRGMAFFRNFAPLHSLPEIRIFRGTYSCGKVLRYFIATPPDIIEVGNAMRRHCQREQNCSYPSLKAFKQTTLRMCASDGMSPHLAHATQSSNGASALSWRLVFSISAFDCYDTGPAPNLSCAYSNHYSMVRHVAVVSMIELQQCRARIVSYWPMDRYDDAKKDLPQ